MQPQKRFLQRERGTLAWGVASFIVLQLGMALAIERWLPEFRDPTYAIKARRLASRAAAVPARPPTVVMVGSSRVEYGLIGRALEEQLAVELGCRPVVFNFGISGAGPVTELLTLKRLLADGVHPDHILIDIVPPLLRAQASANDVARLTPERLRLSELPLVARYGASLAELRAGWWQGWPVPWYSHRYAILNLMAPRFLPGRIPDGVFTAIDEAGGLPLLESPPTPEAHQRNVESNRREFAAAFAEFRLGDAPCRALRDLLALCRQQHIQAALVLMPEGAPFRAMYPPQVWTEVETFLRGLSRDFDVPVINAREWIADELFSDSHHLLRAGGTQFTERLGREYLAPRLARTALAGH